MDHSFVDPITKYICICDPCCQVSFYPNTTCNPRANISFYNHTSNTIFSTFVTFTSTIQRNNRTFSWTFLLADTDKIIIGADFPNSAVWYNHTKFKALKSNERTYSKPLEFIPGTYFAGISSFTNKRNLVDVNGEVTLLRSQFHPRC